MDIAVNLVESYLRINGYLTLSEFEVQARDSRGEFVAVTDVDVMAIRFPGEVFVGDPHGTAEARMLLIVDSILGLEPDQVDVILGEVKQGKAEFNAGMRRHVVLHTLLQRIRWLLAPDDFDAAVDALATRSICIVPARGGGTVRVRLVAFGRTVHNDLNAIGLVHVVATMHRFLSGFDNAFRPVQFREPAPAMLSLLLKNGFELNEPAVPPGG